MKTLSLKPISVKEANEFIDQFHRHSGKVGFGPKFAIGVADKSGELWGVAIVSHPVSRMLNDDGYTGEVRRVCTKPDAPWGCCSMLYSACWRAWKAMGGTRMVTYVLQSEHGTSLRAANWKLVAKSPGHPVGQSWDTHPRAGVVSGTVTPRDKWRWEISADPQLVSQRAGFYEHHGAEGGRIAASRLSAEARSARSRKAAIARWANRKYYY